LQLGLAATIVAAVIVNYFSGWVGGFSCALALHQQVAIVSHLLRSAPKVERSVASMLHP
jgi:biopolymer transport protein ExbB/TolQ